MKTFLTESDIQEYFQRGEKILTLNEDLLLTDLAYEMAQKLGLMIISQHIKPPSAPERPYISNSHSPQNMVQESPSSNGHTISDIRIDLLKINNELFASSLITTTGGNVSVRDPYNPEHLWITPGSIHKGELTPSMMVLIDLEGRPVEPSFPYKASSERYVHCEVLKTRPDFNAVIHTHAPLATVLGLAKIPFLPISTDSAFLGEITRVPFINPGTTDLGKAVADAMKDSYAAIMQNHGLVVAGKTLRSATDMTLIIESTARKIVTSYMLGKEPLQIPPEAIEEFRKELRV